MQQRQTIFPRKFQVLILVPKLISERFLRRDKNRLVLLDLFYPGLACFVFRCRVLILILGHDVSILIT